MLRGWLRNGWARNGYPPRAARGHVSSAQVRQTFLDHFEGQCGHVIRPSVSVVPHRDPSVPFVNAGMVAFKDVLLGQAPPPAPRVANVQKCIRVGGHHHDLAQVGLDGSHHTFFEMLGSWSFGDYGREAACTWAWRLLTQGYGLAPDRLWVSYFAGCPSLGLGPDLATRAVWLALGLPAARLVALGPRDNFWEMGRTGPCGPCTEIYYDHAGHGPAARPAEGLAGLVEVWNLVFIEHERAGDRSCASLPQAHVDTGLGLERLTAVLNGSTSNYDTDLFQPVVRAISQVSGVTPYAGQFGPGAELDTAYRILADHTRMLVVCVGDGCLPDSNHRLRNVMRRMFRQTRQHFQDDPAVLLAAAHEVADILGPVYPEVERSRDKVEIVLNFEREHYQHVLDLAHQYRPRLVALHPQARLVEDFDVPQIFNAVEFIQKHQATAQAIRPEVARHCVDSFGLNSRLLRLLSEVTGLPLPPNFDIKDLPASSAPDPLEAPKFDLSQVPPTDDGHKYTFSSPEEHVYQFPMLRSNVVAMFSEAGESVQSLQAPDRGVIFMEHTCLYATAGGQDCDLGTLEVGKNQKKFEIEKVEFASKATSHVGHFGVLTQGSIAVGDKLKIQMKPKRRLGLMQNHTGTHLLNAALNTLLPLTSQKSSHVTDTHFSFDFSVFSEKFNVESVAQVEKHVNQVIGDNLEITRQVVPLAKLSTLDKLVTVPGTHYPDPTTLIRLPDGHVEPCCGTHMLRTGDVQAFAIVNMSSPAYGIKSVKCVTGPRAVSVRETGIKLIERAFEVRDRVAAIDENATKTDVRDCLKRARALKTSLSTSLIPYTVCQELGEVVSDCISRLSVYLRGQEKEGLVQEFTHHLKEHPDLPFVVHRFHGESDMKTSLTKIARKVKDRPILLLALFGEFYSATALVPEKNVTPSFNAEIWLNEAVEALGTQAKPPRGQSRTSFCVAKFPSAGVEQTDLDLAMDRATQLADKAVNVG